MPTSSLAADAHRPTVADFPDRGSSGRRRWLRIAGRSPAERAVLNFVSGHLGDADQQFLKANQFKIEHLTYDWSLNEQGRE